MKVQTVYGILFLLLCTFFITAPGITGAAVGSSMDTTTVLFSLPFIALGAAIIASALREVFAND